MSVARRLLPPVIVIALLAVGSVGCGSGVAPKNWARSVCAALTPWRSDVSALTRQAQQQMSSTTTPVQAKQNLVALLAGAETASEHARRKVAEAGTPDVTDGKKIATHFVASLSAARDAYGHARGKMSTLDPSDARVFYDGVAAAFGQLNTEYAASALDTRQLGSAELQRAFAEVPECQ
jgi:hypothetical protein